MFRKTLLILAIAAASTTLHAQSTPAKKELVARILKAQQPGMDVMARELVAEPAGQIMGRAGNFLQTNVPPDKQEAVAKDIQSDVRKFVDELTPVIRDRAVRVAPTTIGTLLEEKFSEDELKQIATMMESPVFLKFQSLGGEMQKVLVEKVVAETRTQVESRYKALDEQIGKRLQPYASQAQAPARAASGARAPAKK
jgi:hypothetical protein